jgi:NTE family protein
MLFIDSLGLLCVARIVPASARRRNGACFYRPPMVAAQVTQPPSSRGPLGQIVAGPLFRDLPAAVLDDIAAALEPVDAPGGACLVHRGQTGVPLFLISRGGVRTSFVDGDGRRRVFSEYFRGSTVGEALVLSGRASPLDMHALRDSHLLQVTPAKLNEIMARHPELAMRFARVVTGRLLDLLDSRDTIANLSSRCDRLPRSVAIVGAGSEQVRRTRDLLADALSAARTTIRLTGGDAREALDGGVDRYLDKPSGLVVFECDRSDLSWLDFCVRQADRILVLIDEDECPPPGEEPDWWRTAKLEGRPGHLEVAVVHRPSIQLPQSGSGFAQLPEVSRLHHVRGADRQDAERLARWLMDRPVGLVLGGGAAYGIAHVGVLKALEEERVPVDIVGGTSMGSIFAGGIALGWPADRIMAEVRSLFSSRFALYDPTLPLRALFGGKKLDRVLRGFFEDIPIVDLWRPFFCVATNLSTAQPRVHESGSLFEAIRSSCSMPGVFPPWTAGEHLLVDGGLVDNLPIDVMDGYCRGPVIAVDVSPHQRQPKEAGAPSPSGGSTGLWRRLVQLAQVPLLDTLMRSTMIGSQHTVEMSLARHPPALRLIPPLRHFAMLDWGGYEAIYQAGYACARRELEAGALPRSLWEGRIEDQA